jgi:HD domain
MYQSFHPSLDALQVAPRLLITAKVRPGIIGDIPKVFANSDGIYEGDLVTYFRALFFEARNLANPYHNLRHMLHVTWLCYKAVEFYRHEMSRRDGRSLLIAALFHDFDHPGHSGPEVSDQLNIEVAIAGLRRHLLPIDRDAFPEIERLIEATEYPYTRPARSLDLAAKIIRDADLAQALSPAWIQQVVIGLAAEAKLPPLDLLRAQRSFLAALRFNTEWARQLFPRHLITAKINEAESLLHLLEDPASTQPGD